jgi:plastocyanin
MLRSRRARLLPAAALAAALLAVSAGLALAADQSVAIQNFAFSPDSVTVNVGDSVTWTNNDAEAHTATADDGSWDTGSLAQGASGSVTFDTAGEFAYHCEFHSNMTGTVIVQAAAAATPGAGTPAATNPPTDTVAGEPGQPPSTLAGGALILLGVAIFAVTFLLDRRLDRR